jgi:hypothetical protein
LLAGGALFLWCALVAVIPAADAYAERASAGARSHVEATGGSPTCPPVHNELACQLCRLLRLPIKAGDPSVILALVAVRASLAPRTEVVVVSSETESGYLGRAPPTA